MKTVYYTNSSLDDTEGAGLTIASYIVNDDGEFLSTVMLTEDGKPFLGYMPKEITEEQYSELEKQIANPDRVNYFPSMFGGRGVINKKAREILDEQGKKAKEQHCKQQCEANSINFKLAKLDADAIGEDHEAVFTAKHPSVTQDVIAMLFSKADSTR